MVSVSCPALPRQAERTSSRKSFALLLAVLLTPSFLFAGSTRTPDAPAPAIESSAEKIPLIKDPKILEKYDIERIGQRGIGRGFNLYSLKREHELGENMASAFDHTTKIVSDPVVSKYVDGLAQKLVRYSDADIPFTVKVIDYGDVPRAYGLPGGFLYVGTALILSADGEAELAAMLAREIAHVAARHATRALTRRQLCNIVGSAAYVAGPAGAGFADVSGLAGPLSTRKFARDSEYEADLLGMEYAYAAGYDPQALVDALEKFHALEIKQKADLTKIPGYRAASHMPFHSKLARGLANYPLTEQRIERLQSEIVTFLPTRKDYIVDTEEFQQVRSRLLASKTPTLRRHSGDDNQGPVLRRTTTDYVEPVSPPNVASRLSNSSQATAFSSIPEK